MKRNLFFIPAMFVLILLLAFGCQQKKEKTTKSQIYNPTADARADIKAAIQKASAENKNILLMFGGNWCPWCRLLHELFNENEAVNQELEDNFVLVMIDLGRGNKNMAIDSTYGHPNKLGLPALVVLDQTGKQLCLQETGSLEFSKKSGKKGHNPTEVLAFLRKWKPTEKTF